MNIEFATHEIIFDKTPGYIEKICDQSFSSDIRSAQLSLQGFTLNYEHKEHSKTVGDEHDDHIACVDLELLSIIGNKLKYKASAKTPEHAPVRERRVKILFTAIT